MGELQAVLGSIECNSFDIWSFQRNRLLGVGLYVAASLFNHSCAPNVARVQRGCQVEFYALTAVQMGEALCIAYINPRIADATARRSKLLAAYGFSCTCKRCEGVAESPVLCRRHLGYVVPHLDGSEPGWCTVCDVRRAC